MDAAPSSSFFYQPPSGGDVSLRSSDGTIFLVHSLLLHLGSSVFADMFSTATHNDIIELSNDSESVSLMLRFIYPPVFMDDLPIELLGKSLRMAQKYDISGIVTAIDHAIIFYSSNEGSLIRSNPIRAFCLAAKYHLPGTRKAAMAALRPEKFAFEDPEGVKAFANAYPSAASAIGLLGAHCVRTKILSDLLFGDGEEDILPNMTEIDTEACIMMCGPCFDRRGHEIGIEDVYEPSWYTHWKVMAFCAFTCGALDKCNQLFQAPILDILALRPNVCEDCIHATRTALDAGAFQYWARKANNILGKRLKEVECLYDL